MIFKYLVLILFKIVAAQFPTDICTRLDCNNHGTCIGLKAAPICICDLTWVGLRCDKPISSDLFDKFNLFEANPFMNNVDPLQPIPSPVIPDFDDWLIPSPNELFPWLQPQNDFVVPMYNPSNDKKETTSSFLTNIETSTISSDNNDNILNKQQNDDGENKSKAKTSINHFPINNLSLPNNDLAKICGPQDCNNNGVCIGTKSAPICLCYLGYTGKKCENDAYKMIKSVDGSGGTIICAPSDCNNNGVCIGTKASFTCLCKLGYTGSRCETTPYPLCDITDCNNNGLCIGTKKSFKCACHLGFSGERCEIANGTLCDIADCNHNGICLGTKTQFSCLCNLGYSGKRCETRMIDQISPIAGGLFCELKDCNNNGLCIGSKLLPTCLCAPGYLGLRCELEPLCFSPLQCSGNGICLGTQKKFICTCNLGWTGPNCQYFAGLGKK